MQLAAHYADHPNVHIDVLDNNRGRGNATVVSLDALKALDYNATREQALAALEAELQAGRISEAVYRGFAGRARPQVPGEAGGRQGEGASTRTGGQSEPQPAGKVDPIVAAARTTALTFPDLQVPTGEIGPDGTPVVMTADQVLARGDAEIEQAQTDSLGFKAAADCFLQFGVS
jgi:hypothetical protein